MHAATSNDDALANQMVESLDNLALAATQKNETIEKLIEMNSQKDKTIASLTKSLEAEKATNTKLLYIITQSIGSSAQAATNKVMNGAFTAGSGNERKWDPEGYCWSHCYRVSRNHSSKTCTQQREGHKEEATRANTMGGSSANSHWKPK